MKLYIPESVEIHQYRDGQLGLIRGDQQLYAENGMWGVELSRGSSNEGDNFVLEELVEDSCFIPGGLYYENNDKNPSVRASNPLFYGVAISPEWWMKWDGGFGTIPLRQWKKGPLSRFYRVAWNDKL